MMNADFFYNNAFGRGVLKLMMKAGMFKPVAGFLSSGISKHMIPGYIKKNNIDMSPYGEQKYASFAEFFGRRRDISFDDDPKALIAPCDSMLSVYGIKQDLEVPIKGSHYTVSDLIPDEEYAGRFRNGLCLVFRLEASDYHHFCFFDNGKKIRSGFVPGLLHSVQPIALRHFPVFRLNRRWWDVLETEHFGLVAQTEIGAMAVGGVSFAPDTENFKKGQEMGNFELAGSTIVLLLNPDAATSLMLNAGIGSDEVRVTIGSVIGRL